MRGFLPALALLWGVLSLASVAAAAGSDILVVVCDNTDLASAVVNATSQQYAGPVALAPARWTVALQPGTVRLQVAKVDDRRWRLTLAGADATLSREIAISGKSRQLDVAEAIALAVPGLVTRLGAKSKAAKAHESAREVAAPVATPCVCPPAPVCPTPPPAGAARLPAPAVELVQTTPAEPLHRPPWRRWTLGLMPAMYLSGRTTLPGGGAEAVGSFAFSRGWLAELSVGGYSTHAYLYDIGVVPMDALIASRMRWGRLSVEMGLGAEVNLATAPVGTSVSFAVVTELTIGVHLTDAWLLGVRGTAAFIPGDPDIGPSQGDTSNTIFLSQGQARVGLFVAWML